jgi:hypothetical protein
MRVVRSGQTLFAFDLSDPVKQLRFLIITSKSISPRFRRHVFRLEQIFLVKSAVTPRSAE